MKRTNSMGRKGGWRSRAGGAIAGIAIGVTVLRSHAAVTVTQDISPGHQTIPFQYNASEFAYRFSLTPATDYLFVTGDQHVDPAPEGEDADGPIEGLSPAWSSITITNDQSLFESELTHLLPATTVFKPAFHGNLRPAPRGGGGGGGTMPVYPWSGVAQDDDQFHIEPYMAFVAVGATQGSTSATFDALPVSLAGIGNTTWESNPSGLLTISPGAGASVTVASMSATPAGLYETKARRDGGAPVDTAHVYGVEVDLDVPGLPEDKEETPGLWVSIGETVEMVLEIGPGDLPHGNVTLRVSGTAAIALNDSGEACTAPVTWQSGELSYPATLVCAPLSGGTAVVQLDYESPTGVIFSDRVVVKCVNVDLTAYEPLCDDDGNIESYASLAEELEEDPGVWVESGLTKLVVEDPGTPDGELMLECPAAYLLWHPEFGETAIGKIAIPCADIVGACAEFIVLERPGDVVTATAEDSDGGSESEFTLSHSAVPATDKVCACKKVAVKILAWDRERSRWNYVERLRVAKWENAFTGADSPALKPDFVDTDIDRFRITVVDLMRDNIDNGGATVQVSCAGAVSDAATPVPLMATNHEHVFQTKWQLLVSDTIDDSWPVDGIEDEAPGDRTHMVALDGTVTASYAHEEGMHTATATVPAWKNVTVNLVILTDREGGTPVIDEDQVVAQWEVVRQRFAQVGVLVNWTPPRVVDLHPQADPGKAVRVRVYPGNMDSHSLYWEAKLVIAKAGGLASTSDIHVLYANDVVVGDPGDTVFGSTVAAYYYPHADDAAFIGNIFVRKDAPLLAPAHELCHQLANAGYIPGTPTNLMREGLPGGMLSGDDVTDAKRLTQKQEDDIRRNMKEKMD